MADQVDVSGGTPGPAGQTAGGEGGSQFGLTAAMALIVGSIIGVGIFNLPPRWAPFFLAPGAALAIGAAAVVLVTFVFTTLIHEPASIVTLLAVLVLSIALDFGWKRVRDSRARGGTTSDVQAGN